MPARPPRTLDVLGLLARVVLGGVLIAAGALKVTEPDVAARAVQAYQVLPYDLAATVGHALPVVEIIVGLLLVVGLFTRVSAVVASLLMLAFLVGIGQAWARGLSIDCGCFGGGGQVAPGQTRYVSEIARDLGLLACGLWLVRRPRSVASVDARWGGRAGDVG